MKYVDIVKVDKKESIAVSMILFSSQNIKIVACIGKMVMNE
jgi:hypothetical protein